MKVFTEEETHNLKLLVISLAAQAYLSTRLSSFNGTADEAEEISNNLAKLVEHKFEENEIILTFPILEMGKVPPFYACIPATIKTGKFQESVSRLIAKTQVFRGVTIRYQFS